MRALVFGLALVLIGCSASNQSIGDIEHFDLGAIISELIKTGNVDRDVPIVNHLKRVEYYTREYSEDSLLWPPPTPFARNEEDIIEMVDSEYFPGDSITKRNIRDQLLFQNSARKPVILENRNLKLRKFEKAFPGRCIIFYKPIFNLDSSAIYLQYDEYYGYFGGGGIYLLVKGNDKWLLEKAIHIWEN